MFEGVNDNSICFIVFQYIAKAIPLTYHWENPQKKHDFCNCRFVEHVGPCSEHRFIFESCKYHKGIHQCVAVVWRDYDRALFRDILNSMNLESPVAGLCIEVNYGTQNGIEPVVVVYIFLSHVLIH